MNDRAAKPNPPRSRPRRAGSCRRASISSLMCGLLDVLLISSSYDIESGSEWDVFARFERKQRECRGAM
jgi:hypothetical protein